MKTTDRWLFGKTTGAPNKQLALVPSQGKRTEGKIHLVGGCRAVRILWPLITPGRGSRDQQIGRTGLYQRVAKELHGRPVYKQFTGPNWLFYARSPAAGFWLIGEHLGKNDGGLAVVSSAYHAEDIERHWREWRPTGWKTVPKLRAVCASKAMQAAQSKVISRSPPEQSDLVPKRTHWGMCHFVKLMGEISEDDDQKQDQRLGTYELTTTRAGKRPIYTQIVDHFGDKPSTATYLYYFNARAKDERSFWAVGPHVGGADADLAAEMTLPLPNFTRT